MSTIKLVIVGASGVGKTSFRVKYISGRFSMGYRPTIGVDFITKTIPSPVEGGEAIVVQIWDTAGQERFSSLSTAFFRGADAVILMYDVNDRSSLYKLTKWWTDFCAHAPVRDEERGKFCVVVVGNKVDVYEREQGRGGDREEREDDGRGRVTREEAMRFLKTLVPLDDDDDDDDDAGEVDILTLDSVSQPEEPFEADSEQEMEGELSSSQYTIMPRRFPGVPSRPTNAKVKSTPLAKNRLFTFPNGLLSKVGFMSSTSVTATTTTSVLDSSTTTIIPDATIPSNSTTTTNAHAVTATQTQNNTTLYPSPSQRLLKGLTTTTTTTTATTTTITTPTDRSMHITNQSSHLSRMRSHPQSLSRSHSFYTGTFTSAHSGSGSGFSVYHTPDASVGSFSDDHRGGRSWGGMVNDTETETEAEGDGEWYDARTDVSSMIASRDVSRSASRSSYGNGSVVGRRKLRGGTSRSVSRKVSSSMLGNGDESVREEPRRTSSLATLTNLTVHGELTGSTISLTAGLLSTGCAPAKGKLPPTTTSSRYHARSAQPPLAISTTVSGSSTKTTGTVHSDASMTSVITSATTVDDDHDMTIGSGTGDESESSGSAVTITPARLLIFGSKLSSSSRKPSGSCSSLNIPWSSSYLAGSSDLISTSASTLESTSSFQPSHGPALFFASAKTGFNVEEVFQYVARRVVDKWEGQEEEEERERERDEGFEMEGGRGGMRGPRARGRGRGRGRWKIKGSGNGVGNEREGGTVRLVGDEERGDGRCGGGRCST